MANGEASWADEKRTLASKNDVRRHTDNSGLAAVAGSHHQAADRAAAWSRAVQGQEMVCSGGHCSTHMCCIHRILGFEAKRKGYADIGGRCRQVTPGINHLLSL